MTLIDFEKVYYSVTMKQLWEVMRRMNAVEKWINMTQGDKKTKTLINISNELMN